MATGKNNQSPESAVYAFVSLAVIVIFLAAAAYLLMSLTGARIHFDDDRVKNGAADNNNNRSPQASADVTKITDITLSAEQDKRDSSMDNIRESEPDDTRRPAEETVSAFAPSPLENMYPGTVLPVSEDAGREYMDSIIFLGDSTTYGLRHYAMLDGGKNTLQVWTPLSGTLTLSQAGIAKIYYPDNDTEITIAEAVQLKKPRIIVITLGVNGVSFMDETYFTAEYTKLVKSIAKNSPETKIILQSIFPVARSYAKQQSISNDKITAANGWIVKIADGFSSDLGIRYLDTASVLKDGEGFLPEEFQNGDGMHFNETAFKTELDYIRTHPYR